MTDSAPTSWRDPLRHHAAAWGAALIALAAWWHGWTVPFDGREWSLRIWPGHLLIEALQAVGFALVGLVLGGWWWWAAAWGRGAVGTAGSLALFAVGAGALAGRIPESVGASAAGAWLLWGVVAAVGFRRRRPQRMRDWWRERRPWNVVFFVFFVLLNTASDLLMTGSAPPGWLATAGFVLARFLTQLSLACLIWILLLLGARWWPRGAGGIGWGAVMFAPLLVILDMVLRLAWTKDLHHLCAEIEAGGRVDFLKIREGMGIGVSPLQIALLILVVLAAPAWYFTARWLSGIRGWRISSARMGALALTSWVLLMAVNVGSSAWLSRDWRNWQSRAGVLQITPFALPRGVVTYEVKLANPVAAGPVQAARKPDIFLFIIETMRVDAIAPEQTPFLARWKEEECQQLTETRSAANGTHLSWFSILHGRLPCFYDEATRVTAPAPMLSMLHSAGYAIEVRSGGNFDYCAMFTSNFGDGSITRVMEHAPDGHPDRALAMAERERRLMERLRGSVATSSPGGVFYLTTIDSSHYPYSWHEDWKLPYADYETNPLWPLRPTPAEVDQVRHRYWNSVSWGDHLLGEFVTWLKSQGRYDDAMIVVTGDHGEEFKEHGSWFHCSALNPQQTRVPILVKWPAAMGRGPALTDASHLDLLPSMLDAAGVPEQAWHAMPGRSLRRTDIATSIMNTCYNSQNGEAMLWRRDGWEAAFSWHSPWILGPPDSLWLERIDGPEGTVNFTTPEEYEKELRSRFPDAFGRVFSDCRRVSK